jgi:D-arabinose 1-dehydrogenase-like Zn-dependent alcohol dehydrogenase
LEKPGKIILKEFPIPEIGHDEGLLKVEMVGVCSTDIKIYKGNCLLTLLTIVREPLTRHG